MTDHLRRIDSDYGISRREFLRATGAFIGAAAVAYAGREISNGVRFNEPPVNVRDKSIGEVEFRSSGIFGERGGALSVTGGTLLFDPSGDYGIDSGESFFASGKNYRYIHRANKITVINEAYEDGANLFDIDVNNVGGVLYAEHGIILQAGNRRLPFVVDVNEWGVKFGRPAYTYEELVQLIGSLSKECGRTLGVSAELKRGVFDFDAIHQLLDIHQRHEVPAMMHGHDSENILLIGDEIAAIYHTP